jgi:hypothetical protein
MKLLFKIKILIMTTLLVTNASAKRTNNKLVDKIKYKTFFNKCPSQLGGKLTLILTREFEKNNSLKEVKEKIIKEKLDEKYFLSNYKIQFDPIKSKLKFNFECPEALMKVQIYKDNGDEFYTAILVDSGKLVDPTYEVLLRAEKKIKGKLPELALPVSALDDNTHLEVTDLVSSLSADFRSKISEVIVSENKELTIILSINNRPSSVFLGKDYWSEKVVKLVKVVTYMKAKKSVPAIINLTNSKKIVVKFSDTI